MTVLSQVATDTEKLRVFISYSRDDLAFADQLDATLKLVGFNTTIDRHGIDPGEDWKTRLGGLIRDTDTVVFVLTPSSARSDICAWEVEEAKRLGKRILPVVPRSLDGAGAPPGLAALNYIFFYAEPKKPGSGFGQGLLDLVGALNTDLEWLREHTRYLQRATEWDAGGRPPNRLLSGGDIALAKAWAARRPKDAPAPTGLHLDFIRASEDWETRQQSEERQRLQQMAEAQAAREAALADKEAAQQREAVGVHGASCGSRWRGWRRRCCWLWRRAGLGYLRVFCSGAGTSGEDRQPRRWRRGRKRSRRATRRCSRSPSSWPICLTRLPSRRRTPARVAAGARSPARRDERRRDHEAGVLGAGRGEPGTRRRARAMCSRAPGQERGGRRTGRASSPAPTTARVCGTPDRRRAGD